MGVAVGAGPWKTDVRRGLQVERSSPGEREEGRAFPAGGALLLCIAWNSLGGGKGSQQRGRKTIAYSALSILLTRL